MTKTQLHNRLVIIPYRIPCAAAYPLTCQQQQLHQIIELQAQCKALHGTENLLQQSSCSHNIPGQSLHLHCFGGLLMHPLNA